MKIFLLLKYFNLKKYFILLLFLSSCNLGSDDFEINYYKNNLIKSKYPLKEGLRHGIGVVYFESGKIKQKSTWKNGIKHGKTIKFYSNGVIELRVDFIDGLQEGEALKYDSMGSLCQMQVWKGGQLEGPFEKYYEDGKISVKGNYFDNGASFVSHDFYHSGDYKCYMYVKDSLLLYKKTFMPNGEIDGVKFPLSVKSNAEDQLCIKLEHTYINMDSLNIRFYLGSGTYDEVVKRTNKDVFTSDSLSVCLNKDLIKEKEKGKVIGYLCEVFVPNKETYQGCYPVVYP